METRAPAQAPVERMVAQRRELLSKLPSFARACPPEITGVLRGFVEEHVSYPPCPALLEVSFVAAKPFLRAEESSTIEELLHRQCRTLNREAGDDGIERLLGAEPATRAPGAEDDAGPADRRLELGARSRLRDVLLGVRSQQEPFDAWVRANGELVVSEDMLAFLEHLVVKRSCRLTDDEIDQSYRTLRGLEDLARLGKEGEPQRTRIETMLRGIHRIIDRKIEEFFRR